MKLIQATVFAAAAFAISATAFNVYAGNAKHAAFMEPCMTEAATRAPVGWSAGKVEFEARQYCDAQYNKVR